MRQFLHKSKANGRAGEGAGVSDQTWRLVPKINVLSEGTRKAPIRRLVKALIVLLVLIEAIWIQSIFASRGDLDKESDAMTAQISSVQQQLASRNGVIQELEAEIQRIQEAQGAANTYEAVLSRRIGWTEALSALFDSRVPGVELATMTTSPEGVISLTGVAADTVSMVNFQRRLLGSDDAPELLSLDWRMTGDPTSPDNPGSSFEFTASLKVK